MAVSVLVSVLLLAAMMVDLSEGQGGSILPTKGRECFGNTMEHLTKSMELMKAFRFAKITENKNLSCISSCLMKKYLVMSDDGTLDPAKAKKMVQKIKDPTFKSIIEMRLTSCIEDAVSEDECQSAGKFVDCVAKSGSYKNWGSVVAKNFKSIFGPSAPPPQTEPPAPVDVGESGSSDSESSGGRGED